MASKTFKICQNGTITINEYAKMAFFVLRNVSIDNIITLGNKNGIERI